MTSDNSDDNKSSDGPYEVNQPAEKVRKALSGERIAVSMDFDDKTTVEPNTAKPQACKSIGCCFFGNSKTDGYCSVCYKKHQKDNNSNQSSSEKSKPVATSSNTISIQSSSTKPISINTTPISQSVNISTTSTSANSTLLSTSAPLTSETRKRKRNRCGVCKKKIGLTGFECKCGGMFCAIHRYTDQHPCEYDFKSEERAKLKKENPIVEDAKIEKI